MSARTILKHVYENGGMTEYQYKRIDRVLKERERPNVEWGKWVISEVRCPECLEYFDPEDFSKEEMDKCPNCGADMRKEGEGNG